MTQSDCFIKGSGWKISTKKLPIPKTFQRKFRKLAQHYPYYIFENEDKSIAVVFHHIVEIRMGTDAGSISVFSDKKNPKTDKDINEMWGIVCGPLEDTVVWLSNSIFVVRFYYKGKNDSRPQSALILIDLKNRKFGSIKSKNPNGIKINIATDDFIELEEWTWNYDIHGNREILHKKVIFLQDIKWTSFPLASFKASIHLAKKAIII
ncbi:hypothetical protein C0416_03900 [bacterium]|nr:hypothetical protein [bacterium]